MRSRNNILLAAVAAGGAALGVAQKTQEPVVHLHEITPQKSKGSAIKKLIQSGFLKGGQNGSVVKMEKETQSSEVSGLKEGLQEPSQRSNQRTQRRTSSQHRPPPSQNGNNQQNIHAGTQQNAVQASRFRQNPQNTQSGSQQASSQNPPQSLRNGQNPQNVQTGSQQTASQRPLQSLRNGHNPQNSHLGSQQTASERPFQSPRNGQNPQNSQVGSQQTVSQKPLQSLRNGQNPQNSQGGTQQVSSLRDGQNTQNAHAGSQQTGSQQLPQLSNGHFQQNTLTSLQQPSQSARNGNNQQSNQEASQQTSTHTSGTGQQPLSTGRTNPISGSAQGYYSNDDYYYGGNDAGSGYGDYYYDDYVDDNYYNQAVGYDDYYTSGGSNNYYVDDYVLGDDGFSGEDVYRISGFVDTRMMGGPILVDPTTGDPTLPGTVSIFTDVPLWEVDGIDASALIGLVQGTCTRLDVAGNGFCSLTFEALVGSEVIASFAAEGPVGNEKFSTLAVKGGLGDFEGVTGEIYLASATMGNSTASSAVTIDDSLDFLTDPDGYLMNGVLYSNYRVWFLEDDYVGGDDYFLGYDAFIGDDDAFIGDDFYTLDDLPLNPDMSTTTMLDDYAPQDVGQDTPAPDDVNLQGLDDMYGYDDYYNTLDTLGFDDYLSSEAPSPAP